MEVSKQSFFLITAKLPMWSAKVNLYTQILVDYFSEGTSSHTVIRVNMRY